MNDHTATGESAAEKNRNWWSDIDDTILECLDGGRTMTAGEIAGKLGISEGAASSFLALLAIGDRVRIRAVEGVRRRER